MRIDSINTKNNFNALYADQTMMLGIMLQGDYFIHNDFDMKNFFSKIAKCKQQKYADVFVTKNKEVYIRDNETNTKLPVNHHKTLFENFYIALSRASMMEQCYKDGLNPYEYMD